MCVCKRGKSACVIVSERERRERVSLLLGM